jgi:PST family polysaccharide transporter
LIDKSLNFRAKFWIEVTSAVLSGAVAVGMALRGAGVWSLVGQSLASATTRLTITWHLSTWRPSWSFDPKAFRELFKFSSKLMANGILSYCGSNIDRLVLGRFMGSVDLGLYSFAFRSVSLPLDLTTSVTNSVMFPAFSIIQGERSKVSRAYLRSTRIIALITFPITTILAVLAEPIVLLVYGERWRASIPIVRILALSGMAQSVYNTAAWLFLSQGRADLLFRMGVYAAAVRACGAAGGISRGVIGVAWAYVLGSFGFLGYPTWHLAGSLVGLRFKQIVANLAGPLLCAVGMGAIIWIADQWMFRHLYPWLRLEIALPLGVLVYGLLIRQAKLEAWSEARAVLLDLSVAKFTSLRRVSAGKWSD